jgi:hypothetical protein
VSKLRDAANRNVLFAAQFAVDDGPMHSNFSRNVGLRETTLFVFLDKCLL